jgi:hypothetical protein
MGAGLKRVAKQCGGLIARDSNGTVHYGGEGNRMDTPPTPDALAQVLTRGGWPLLTRGLTDRLKGNMRERFGETRKTARMMRPKIVVCSTPINSVR